MQSDRPSRGIQASRPGFVFLVISLVLAAMFVTTIFFSFFFWVPHIVAALESGAVLIVIDFPETPPGFGVDRLDKVVWSWRGVLWPTIRLGEFGQGGTIPLWIFLLSSTLTSWHFYRRARRKQMIGHCPNCEYDLTGNTSGVCPECGRPIPPQG